MAVITRNNRPTRTSRASISSVSSLSSVVSEVASSCPASPVAPGLDNFSDRPGSLSYVEMVTGSRSRSPSPADSVSGAIGERLNSLSIKKDESSSVRGDAISLSTAEDDVVMEDAPLNNARCAISGEKKNASRSSKSVSKSKSSIPEKLKRFNRKYDETADLLDKLVEKRDLEEDESKRKTLKIQIREYREDLDYYEERITKLEVSANEISQKINEVGNNTNNTRESEPTVPIKVIPPFRLLVSAAYNPKYYSSSKVSPDDVKNDNAFKTVKDFIRKFEAIVKHYGVNIDKKWLGYLQLSIENGQDDRSINWLQHKLTVADFKNSNWEGAKTALIGKFGESFTYLQYRQKLMRIKQPNGEYLNMYVDRYIDLLTKAKFADSPLAVMHFLGTLLPPVKDCLERRLAEIRAKKNADFILEDDTLSKIQTIIENNKMHFIEECKKIFPGLKNQERSQFKPADKKAPRQIESKRKFHGDEQRHFPENKNRERNFHKKPAHSAPKCRYCGEKYTPGHLDKCREMEKRRDHYLNKDTGCRARKDAPKNYTGNFSQRRRSFEEKIHNANDSRITVHNIEKVEKQTTTEPEIMQTHPADEVMNDLLNDDEIISPFQKALKQIREKKKHKQALVDTGADVSFISKNAVNKLKLSIIPVHGSLLLADKEKTVKRLGVTDKLNVGYKGQTVAHEFEVLNMHDKVDAIFGRDILPSLGIHLVGVATNWDDNKVKFDDSIEDSEYIPNVSNAGTPEEHEALLQALQSHIDKNQRIDVHSLCNLPEAVYPIANKMMPIFDEAVKTWLENGVIVRAPPSPWNSPITFAPKKDANGNPTDYRPCIDPRKINALLESDNYPLPLIDDIFHDLAGSTIFTSLDLKSAFHRLPIRKSDQVKTTFTHRNKQYMFRSAPFGLKHVSSHFMRIMNLILSDLSNVHVYVDDIVVGTPGDSMEKHYQAVSAVIDRLTQHNMILNPQKCHFGKRSVHLLGFCISEKGKSLDPRKLTNIADWPRPKTGREMMQWLGTVNYFRAHIPCAATLTAPLDALRNVAFIDDIDWTPELQVHFQSIKDILCSNVVLSPYDPTKSLYVATDASNTGVGAVLFQKFDEKQSGGLTVTTIKYLGFMARSLSQSERNYSVTRRELLAIVFALKKFHKFLYGHHFTLYSDHRALTYLFTSDELNPMMVGWMDTLLSYDFDIVHIPGVQNVLPDALSRLFPPEKELAGSDSNNSTVKHQNLAYKPNLKKEHELKMKKENRKVFYVQSPTKFSDKDYITPPYEDRQEILDGVHKFGHFGADHIVKSIHNQNLHWPNLLADAVNYVSKCNTCQKYNIAKKGYNPHRPVYAYVPGDAYAFDLIGPFQSSSNMYTYVLILVDICTRFCVLKPLVDKKAKTVAGAMVDTFSLLGYPRHFVCSDNGSEFKNEILENLFNAMGIDKRYTTPYHPSANGAAERYVQSAKKILAKFLEGATEDWHHYIPSVQLMINNKISTRLQTTPFSLMFARNINDFIEYRDDAGELKKKEYMPHDELLKRIDYMSQVVFPAIQDRTDLYTKRQKEKADSKNRQSTFPEGSYVMVRDREQYNSLSPVYKGPYRVVRQVQGGAYILRDVDETLMSRNYSPEELKLISQDEIIPKDELYEIEAIINHRGEPGNREYLVRWKNYSKDDDSWLTAEAFTDPESINIYWRKMGKSINQNGEVVKKKNNEAEKNKKQKLPSDYAPNIPNEDYNKVKKALIEKQIIMKAP
ncbi:hypothetical protein RO3G_15250 [Rhizopus delemar RA 99-880]|uniref:RNA-directed DNA polymerase n=1 Tax=Rhizopus delemar (strain RA 99-880 / ATCC MYA-4621 / FGSC 9543 / NRRL 43880) TaxID=246409 RepID=I1CQ09_RHIO9|nr:hypothetical protein RO3G_15250 [Rhizopus delemar RA 99-880]|eukprot:EIE90539.1 hypothetical protein RO3G_15250 [Rhizopus delemar RA 99-880]